MSFCLADRQGGTRTNEPSETGQPPADVPGSRWPQGPKLPAMGVAFCLLALWAGGAASGQTVQLGPGERLSVMRFTLRLKYVVPNQVTVPEGWYRITVDDPHMIGARERVDLDDDERMTRLASQPRSAKGSRTNLYQRLTPGRKKLRVGTRSEWVVTVNVTPRAGVR